MTNYDDLPYPDFIHPATHPGNMAAIARLHGVNAPPPESCRVLELACGPGGNLISLATLLPSSHFEGVDFAAGHVKTGNAMIGKLGLTNIELHHAKIEDWVTHPESEQDRFDYIIAHGVYSWVPEEVRQSILAICQMRLSTNGIALISYNTYPGWHQRQMARDMMRYHADGIEDPHQRLRHGKALLSSVAQNVPPGSAYRVALEEELKALDQANEAYISHEQFEDTNRPCYFHEFAAEAGAQCLQVIAEADWGDSTYEQVRPDVAAALASLPKIRRGQTLDFFRRRTFRQTLMCHESVAVSEQRQAAAMQSMHFVTSSNLQGDQITGTNGLSGTVDHPATQQALECLVAEYPASMSYQELCAVVETDEPSSLATLQADLFNLVCVGLVSVSASPTDVCRDVSSHPRATALAREQVLLGETVTNLRHQPIRLDDTTAHLIRCCDGETDHAGLVERMVAYSAANGGLVEGDQVVTGEESLRPLVTAKMTSNLQRLAAMALLVS
ncbi:methyltransferase regulatory domain-containing protein [Rhodopirellula sp. P2]|uniref:methyltransferase regulatory domain-containing protein n=1 Tax=Rhodopirellula sp. P2 TaxID=2127060 RepID=UPI002368122C|nr:class I SAM-dependent methyltransferase [Rhodopirellula sp. P2]WDQ17695.1 class I SAM-dependent methyltransferase [Rhodopirellula sp. P2]